MTTTKLKLPELTASQSQKHVTHNEALFFLDNIVQLSVIDRDLAAPPVSPALGHTYLVGAAPTGSWTGKTNQIASYDGSGWVFFVPAEGWVAWIADEDVAVVYDGAAWIAAFSGGGGGGGSGSSFDDAAFAVTDDADPTKILKFQLSGVTAGATRTLAVPNASGTIALLEGAQTFTGATTFSGSSITVGNNTGTSTLGVGTGATTTGVTKTVNLGTGGASGSTTVVNVGSTTAGALGSLIVNTPTVTFAASVTAIGAAAANVSVARLGLGGATADATNRLSVNTPAVLLNNAGASIDMTFNKNAAGDDATLSFKTGFSTRGIIGLQGDNDLTLKVSPDGSTFNTALILKAVTGRAEVSQPIEMIAQSALPTNPGSGKLAIYPRNRAGQIWLDVLRPSGRDFPLQPHFGVNRIARWSPSTGSTVNIDGMPRTAIGTASTPTLAATNLGTSMRRWTMTSAATASAAAEDRSTSWVCWRGNAAGLGGFTYVNRLSLTTLQATGMGFFGLYGSTSALATTLTLATVINCIGIGFQRGTHTNWQLVHNDGTGAPTLTDLGANFPINTTHVLTLFIMAAPNSGTIGVRVVNETTGNSTEFTISTDMPAANQFLSPHNYMNNEATAAAVAYDCAGVYIETDI